MNILNCRVFYSHFFPSINGFMVTFKSLIEKLPLLASSKDLEAKQNGVLNSSKISESLMRSISLMLFFVSLKPH
jgi:hypothetical protein